MKVLDIPCGIIIAMCGGINLTQSVLSAERRGNTLRANAHYQAGRVLSYTLSGGIVGAVGGVVNFSGRMRGLVLILAGLLMLGMALRMLGVFKFLRGFPVSLPQFRSGGERSNFVVGLLNGFMPCGPLQAMQLYALSRGTFAGGALSMLLFGLGTVPLMFGFGALSGRLIKLPPAKAGGVDTRLKVALRLKPAKCLSLKDS